MGGQALVKCYDPDEELVEDIWAEFRSIRDDLARLRGEVDRLTGDMDRVLTMASGAGILLGELSPSRDAQGLGASP